MKFSATALIVILVFSSICYSQIGIYSLQTDQSPTSEYATIPDADHLDFSGDYTIELWFKLDKDIASHPQYPNILTKEDWTGNSGWNLHFDKNGNEFVFRINGSTGYGANKRCRWNNITYFDDLAWHHIAISYSSSSGWVQMVVDGQLKASAGLGTTPTANSKNVTISNNITGCVENIRIWNTFRDEGTIRNNMNLLVSSPSSNANIIACYRMNDGSGSTCNDESSYNNDATTTGTVTWVNSLAVIGNKSHATEGDTHLIENTDVPVTVYWGVNQPGATCSFSAVQMNMEPEVTTGLPTNYPSTYWWFWMENNSATWEGNDTRFHYDNIDGISNENNLKLYCRSEPGGSWSEVSSYTVVTNDGGSSNTTDGVGYIYTQISNTTGLNQYIIASPNEPLPVELFNLTASIYENSVILEWITATEVNNYGFEIQRAINDEGFINIGFEPGYGNSNSYKEYRFVDEYPPAGNLKYRIKQIDTDGSFRFYGTNIFVDQKITDLQDDPITQNMLFQNYPNPFNPVTTIEFELLEAGIAKLEVYDCTGTRIIELLNEYRNSGQQEITFNAKNLASGVYIYSLTQNNISIKRKMILIK